MEKYKVGDIVEFSFIDEENEQYEGVGKLTVPNANYGVDFGLDEYTLTKGRDVYASLGVNLKDIVKKVS